MHTPAFRLLVVSSGDAVSREILAAVDPARVELRNASSSEEAHTILNASLADAILLAEKASNGWQGWIRQVRSVHPDVPLALVSGEIPDAASLHDLGVSDYLQVPFTHQEAKLLVDKLLMTSEHVEKLGPIYGENGIDHGTASPAMLEALSMADRAAPTSATVLIRGESGVGKDVLARRIHEKSLRAGRPFVKVQCGALPEQILESELFGYEKGAFTGANTRKPGRFELAEGGTLFLDEIGDITPSVQIKLLRVIQDRAYERLGGTKTLHADVRLLAATHRRLERMVKTNEFRKDLYYRLNVVTIVVPALRERSEDIRRLALGFQEEFAKSNGRAVSFSPEALEVLEHDVWPGNVRQLQNVVERLVVLSDSDTISASDVRAQLARDASAEDDTSTQQSAFELASAVRKAERKALKRALDKAHGSRVVAARLLGVSRRTLFYKLREHEIE